MTSQRAARRCRAAAVLWGALVGACGASSAPEQTPDAGSQPEAGEPEGGEATFVPESSCGGCEQSVILSAFRPPAGEVCGIRCGLDLCVDALVSNCGRHPVDDSIAVGVVAGNEEDPTSGTPLAILGTTPGMPSQMGEWIHFVVPWDEWRAYDEQNVFVFADLLQRIDSCGPVGGRVGTFRDGPPCD